MNWIETERRAVMNGIMNIGLQKIWGVSCLSEDLLAPQAALCCVIFRS